MYEIYENIKCIHIQKCQNLYCISKARHFIYSFIYIYIYIYNMKYTY